MFIFILFVSKIFLQSMNKIEKSEFPLSYERVAKLVSQFVFTTQNP